jgi:hypothetical protein
MGYWAATQVKGLSLEITIVSVADAVHEAEGNILITDNWRGNGNPTGSETVARYQKDNMGTREAHNTPIEVWAYYQANKRQGGPEGVVGVGPAHSSDEAS